MTKLTWLDRAIGAISPTWGLRRARARYVTQLMTTSAHYEGAGRGRRTEGWKTRNTSANAESRYQIQTLRDRCRDLVRNSPYANRAVSVIANNVVGTGIIPRAQTDSAARKRRASGVVRAWMDTTLCDARGRRNFYGLQRLAMRAVAESGEVLIRRRWRRVSDGLPIPMQIEVLEADYLDTLKDGPLPNGNTAFQGIEVDGIGRRVAYWLFTEHPGDLTRIRTLESVRVPASEVIHVYREDRPGQMRGIPWGAPVIIRQRDHEDYEQAQLLRQKIAACFAAFVHEPSIDDVTGGTVGSAKPLLESLEPGIVEHLPPGKEISFATPPGVEGYADVSRINLRAIAIGYGVTYEALTGDYSNVNFSSGRMGWLEFQRVVDESRWDILIPQMCEGVWSWVREAAAAAAQPLDGVTVQWTPPRREMIDPTKETEASILAVQGCLTTLSEQIRMQGNDPEDVMAERSEELKQLRSLGIAATTDPASQSNQQAPAAPSEE